VNPLLARLVAGTPSSETAGPSPLAPAAKPPIQKLRYTHEALLDILIVEPWISQNELAARFGMSASWISTIICSDLFQSRLAARREQLVDPEVRFSIKTQMEGLLARSMEVLRHKLNADPDQVPDRLAVQVATMAGKNLGMQAPPSVSVQETHVHLEELGQNLVGLLRRRRSETYDVETNSEGHPQCEPGCAADLRAGPPLQGLLPPSHLGVQPEGQEAGVPGEPGLPG